MNIENNRYGQKYNYKEWSLYLNDPVQIIRFDLNPEIDRVCFNGVFEGENIKDEVIIKLDDGGYINPSIEYGWIPLAVLDYQQWEDGEAIKWQS